MPFTALWLDFITKATIYLAYQINRLPGVTPSAAENTARGNMQVAWGALDPGERAYFALSGGSNLLLRYGSTVGFGLAQP